MDDRVARGRTYRSATGLSDPKTCGEDVETSLNLVIDLAKDHCRDCNGYHLRYMVGRAIRTESPINFDRIELVGQLRAFVAEAGTRQDGQIDIVIPGSADTGILSTCAHAALALGQDIASRVRFTVLDICETPLLLCQAFADRHGIDLTTRRMDLNEASMDVPADIVVIHSLLRYLPADNHVAFLRRMGEWLKPGGKIILSNRLQAARGKQRESHSAALVDKVQSGALKLEVPLQEVLDALRDRTGLLTNFERADDLRKSFAPAGLRIESENVLDKERRPEDIRIVPDFSRAIRYLAVLGKA